jgi:hypothetical protein
VVGSHHVRDHIHPNRPPLFIGDAFAEGGRPRPVPRLTGVVDHLVQRQLRLEIVQELRPVQLPEIEVCLRELPLRQQAGKHKHRVVASRERLLVVQLRQVAAARLLDPRSGSFHPSRRRLNRRMLLQRRPDGLLNGQRALREGGQAQRKHNPQLNPCHCISTSVSTNT